MAKFRTYQLIQLVRAVGVSGELATKCDYKVQTVDGFGRTEEKIMKLHEVERDWCKLRMTGDRYAKLSSGKCEPISQEEFNRLL